MLLKYKWYLGISISMLALGYALLKVENYQQSVGDKLSGSIVQENGSVSPSSVNGVELPDSDAQSELTSSENNVFQSLQNEQRQEYLEAIKERNQARQLLQNIDKELKEIKQQEQELLKTEFEYSIRTNKPAN